MKSRYFVSLIISPFLILFADSCTPSPPPVPPRPPDTLPLVQSPLKELIYQDQTWICPWGCLIAKLDISAIPANTAFAVYIKRDRSTYWVLVPDERHGIPGNPYTYFVDDQDHLLYVSIDESSTATDTPDIKIVY